jgi:hypothetical protein
MVISLRAGLPLVASPESNPTIYQLASTAISSFRVNP